jgi:ankyrin repeat protein
MDALLMHNAPGPSVDDRALRARLAVLATITRRFPGAVNLPNARGQMPLHVAAGAGEVELVESLLAAGGDPNAKDPGGRSVLVYALERRNVALAERLIRAGAVLDPQLTRVVATAASTARAGDLATFRFYLGHGLDPDALDAASRPILFAAIAGGNDSLVDVLIAAGANVHQAEPLGATALHVASLHGRAAMVAALLRAGADVDAKASSATHGMRGGTTPLHWGVKHPEVVRALVAHGAEINAVDSDGQTPLLLSLFGQHTDSALFLLESGANPNLGTKDFMYPILPALEWPEVTEKLIAAGADVNVRDRDQLTPLFFAIKRKRVNLVSLLAEAGADPSAMGPRGTTLVHHAAELPGALEILVKHGADPNVRDANGNTALLVAAATGASDSASALLKAGADIHAANAAGDTPLHVAIRNDRLRVVEILLGAGADPARVNHSGTTPMALAVTASEPIRRLMNTVALAASSGK